LYDLQRRAGVESAKLRGERKVIGR
jgi:hypothetical protein